MPTLIGFDELGRTISIHETQDESGPLFASRIHDATGYARWGILDRSTEPFRITGVFPCHKTIWPSPNYRYDVEAERRRIYSAAIHHAILLENA